MYYSSLQPQLLLNIKIKVEHMAFQLVNVLFMACYYYIGQVVTPSIMLIFITGTLFYNV